MAKRKSSQGSTGASVGMLLGLMVGGSIGHATSHFMTWLLAGFFAGGFLGTIVPILLRRPPKEWAEIARMNGTDFEYWVARQYRRQGWRVKHMGQSGDHGRDLVLTHPTEGWTAIVQCKRWSDRVGEPVLRDLLGTVTYFKARTGICVTTTGYTDPARRWSRTHDQIELVGPRELQQWLKEDLATQSAQKHTTV